MARKKKSKRKSSEAVELEVGITDVGGASSSQDTSSKRRKPMAGGVDLPPNVAELILYEGAINHQQLMADIRGNIANVNSLVRHAAFRQYHELGPVESRAVSGVMATPIASPTTQQGQ